MKRIVWLLICLLGLPTAAQAEPELRGLLVGVSQYKSARFWGPIHGAEDASTVHKVLKQRFQAKEQNLKLLLGPQATREAIVRELETLYEQSRPGDSVVFYYSGHGSVIKDLGPLDEEDGLDECLVPYDAPSHRSKRFPGAVVRDDQVRQWVGRLRERVGDDGQLLLIFDSCHSGTMNRAAEETGLAPRTVPTTALSSDGSMQEQFPDRVAVLSACQADEVATDDQKNGRGVFSEALRRSLQDPTLGPSSNYRYLMTRLRANGRFLKQNPRFEGQGDLPVLGGRAVALPLSAKLLSLDGWLDRGQLAGFYPGSTVVLDKGRGQIVEATPWRARAQFESPLQEQQLAKEVRLLKQSSGPPGLTVYSTNSGLSLPSEVKRVESREQADLVLTEDQPGEYSMWFNSGVRVRSSGSELAGWLALLAKRDYLLRLVHQPQRVELQLRPGSFEDTASASGFVAAQPTYRDGRLSVKPSQQVEARIWNRAQWPLYVQVLSFGPEGEIGLLYAGSGQPLEPDESVALALGFSVTSRFPEGLKVVATREPVNLSGVSTKRAGSHPLARFIGSTLRGKPEQASFDSPESYIVGESVFVHCAP